MLRYLRAFGPASVMGAQSWPGLTKPAAVFERLRPRPDGSVPAPVRFLGEHDNVPVGHADRSRIVPDGFRRGMERGVCFEPAVVRDAAT